MKKQNLKRNNPQEPSEIPEKISKNHKKGENKQANVKNDVNSKLYYDEKKKKNPSYDATKKIKVLFEQLRHKKVSKEQKKTIIIKLMESLSGKMIQITNKPDLSRVVQWLIKLGDEKVHKDIVKEINNPIDLLKQKYARYIIKSIFTYCSASIKRKFLIQLMSETVNMLQKKSTSQIFEDIYDKRINKEQKHLLRQSIFGLVDGKSINVDSYCKEDPGVSIAYLNHAKKNIIALLEKDWIFHCSIFTDAVVDYIRASSLEDKQEVLELLRGKDLTLTKGGCIIFSEILWISNVAGKKKMIKAVQDDIYKLACTDHGNLLIMTLFDCVDDTVLLKKAVLNKLTPNLGDLMKDKRGRRILLYLFEHREAKSFFLKEEIDFLKQADRCSSIKKDPLLRLKELRDAIILPVLEHIKEHPSIWFSSATNCIALVGILKHGVVTKDVDNEIIEVFKSISKYITNIKILEETCSVNDEDGKDVGVKYIIEKGCVNKFLKDLILHDESRSEKNLVTFTQILSNHLTDEILSKWVTVNRGCFLILFLWDSCVEETQKLLFSHLIDQKFVAILREQDTQGAEVLRKKLNDFSKNSKL